MLFSKGVGPSVGPTWDSFLDPQDSPNGDLGDPEGIQKGKNREPRDAEALQKKETLGTQGILKAEQ